jgi:hypothetical protein
MRCFKKSRHIWLLLFFVVSCHERQKVVTHVAKEEVRPESKKDFVFMSTMKATIAKGLSEVTIEDQRTVRTSGGQDFEMKINRKVKGETEVERSFEAKKIGNEYFTKGQFGDFVRWPSFSDEPEKLLQDVLGEGKRFILALGECVGRNREGENVKIFLLKTPCETKWQKDDWVLSVSSLEGEEEQGAGIAKGLSFRIGGEAVAVGQRASVSIEYKESTEEVSLPGAIAKPEVFVEGKRQRPVKMIEEVLGGLGIRPNIGGKDVD